jgi:hypothetical protein
MLECPSCSCAILTGTRRSFSSDEFWTEGNRSSGLPRLRRLTLSLVHGFTHRGMDGYEVVERLRQNAAQSRATARTRRPGTYTATFRLQGWRTYRRDDIELTGSFTATVDAELTRRAPRCTDRTPVPRHPAMILGSGGPALHSGTNPVTVAASDQWPPGARPRADPQTLPATSRTSP